MKYLLKYTVGGIGLATPIDEVKEIVRPKAIEKQETGAKYIMGYFNLRDEKVYLYDLPAFLGISADSVFEVIIANIEGSSIGFKVTRVHGIINTEQLMPFPEIVRVKDYFRGVVRDNGSFLQVLSFKKLMTGSRLTSIRKLLKQ
ncbi:MAG TPA: chemotaxis protein CheW [bacterium]